MQIKLEEIIFRGRKKVKMHEELNLTSTEEIQNLIYTIRGKQVMIDSDVANLYHYETKRINEAVNRNKERFPDDFCFQLTENEMRSLRSQVKSKNNWSQIATSSERTSLEKEHNKHRGKKYLPYVFTEQGIAMLSGL